MNSEQTNDEIRATKEHWPLEIEPLCYTPEEFEANALGHPLREKKQIGIVSEAIKEGIFL